jgi:hypothetical protein
MNWPLRSNIPAVKIADAPALPLLPQSEDSMGASPVLASPEVCLSGGEAVTAVIRNKKSSHRSAALAAVMAAKLEPIDSSLFPVKQEEELPTLMTDEENEDEFGEFLLDAVQWL